MEGRTEDARLVMCVGLVCTDIISVTASYPQEDSDQRVLDQWWHRGGNASNSCTVLSQLGNKAEFLGSLTDDEHLGFFKRNFDKYNIQYDHCVHHPGHQTPVSIVIINKETGTRTILHSGKKLPELSQKSFETIDLSNYKWIHFEGRPNCDDMKLMLRRIDEYNESLEDQTKRITTSVELEKTRDNLSLLEDTADYVFVSKEHAQFRGCQNMTETVNYFATKCRKNATVICPWGDQGAVGRIPDGSLHLAPIFPPPQVVDTLAAGDTFNAATIHALSRGEPVPTAITFGCRVAGAKVGMKGLDGLKQWYEDFVRAS